MNYDSTKQYGTMVRDVSAMILSTDDIFKAAEQIPFNMLDYFFVSRLAFAELYISIEHRYSIVRKIISDYVLNDDVIKAASQFPLNSDENELEFIKRDLGNQLGILGLMFTDIIALEVISQPENYNEAMINVAVKDVIYPRIENTEHNKLLFEMAYNQIKQQSQESVSSFPIYHIGNEELLLHIYKFMREEDVITDEVNLQTFIHMVEMAKANIITPKKKTMFYLSLGTIKNCVVGDRKAWFKQICNSIGIEPTGATKGKPSYDQWCSELQKLVSKYPK
ncbi:MAG: hypothetical protein IJM58_07535 [Muribaculaceae bacterium]|nr:hypothetical protein [Muribaculaceae bacterium]